MKKLYTMLIAVAMTVAVADVAAGQTTDDRVLLQNLLASAEKTVDMLDNVHKHDACNRWVQTHKPDLADYEAHSYLAEARDNPGDLAAFRGVIVMLVETVRMKLGEGDAVVRDVANFTRGESAAQLTYSFARLADKMYADSACARAISGGGLDFGAGRPWPRPVLP